MVKSGPKDIKNDESKESNESPIPTFFKNIYKDKKENTGSKKDKIIEKISSKLGSDMCNKVFFQSIVPLVINNRLININPKNIK